MLSLIRFVLVETSHSGNVGATARAMKNMCIGDLALVQPQCDGRSEEAVARASGAEDVLYRAMTFQSLADACADRHVVIGASARHRSIPHREIAPADLGALLGSDHSHSRVGIVFGREHSGLTNEELDQCHYWLRIPSNPAFSSLNIAAAAQIVAYECFIAHQEQPLTQQPIPSDERATFGELESFYGHLEAVLYEIGFMHSTKTAPSLMRRVRRLFNRTVLESREVNILRGILTAIQTRGGSQ